MTGLAGATETHERDGKHPSRIGVRDMLSYQSLMLAGAGTRRYEKPELWLGTANWHGGFRHAPPRPQRGTSPPRYISLGTLGCRCSDDGGWCRRPVPELIPDRSPGHAFVPIAHAGWRRHTKV